MPKPDAVVVPDLKSKRRAAKLQRACRIYRQGDGFLMDLVVEDMMDRLSAVNRRFEVALALFGQTANLTNRLASNERIGRVVRVEEHDGNLASEQVTDGAASEDSVLLRTLDELRLEAESCDLILAPWSLHWAQDLPGVLIQLRTALRPDGLLLAVLPGPQTLVELRDVFLTAESECGSGAALRVDLFAELRDAGGLLQRAGFALPVADQDVVTVRYNTLFDLVRDLRKFAATSGNSALPTLSRATMMRAAELYQQRYADEDGRIRASFQIVSLSGWKPHESQQKPLKPGSAKARLADALNTSERKA